MNVSWVLANAPYAAVMYGVYKFFPKWLTPTFVIIVFLLSFIQSALILHGSSVFTRACLMYAFVLCWLVFVTAMAAQFVVGQDPWKLLKGLIVTESRTQKDSHDQKNGDADAARDLPAPGVPEGLA